MKHLLTLLVTLTAVPLSSMAGNLLGSSKEEVASELGSKFGLCEHFGNVTSSQRFETDSGVWCVGYIDDKAVFVLHRKAGSGTTTLRETEVLRFLFRAKSGGRWTDLTEDEGGEADNQVPDRQYAHEEDDNLTGFFAHELHRRRMIIAFSADWDGDPEEPASDPHFSPILDFDISESDNKPESFFSPPGLEFGCLQAFPDEIRAKIDIRDRQLRQLVPTGGIGDMSPQFVFQVTKKWLPGQTIKIAFSGGSNALRKQIMEAAVPWVDEQNGGNLNLDFGYDPQTGTFRSWTPFDQSYAADIRISFAHKGYWSLVGTDSNNPFIVSPSQPSLNLGGFHLALPANWRSTVLHEFGHALGFQHEHQHPSGGCDSEFRWEDDPGYFPTTDQFGRFVSDSIGRRPGIYTVLGGPPNDWPRHKVDHNLKQLPFSTAFDLSQFDQNSIMKYFFREWMFAAGTQSHCFTPAQNLELSPTDLIGMRKAYPFQDDPGDQVSEILSARSAILGGLLEIPGIETARARLFETQLDSIKEIEATLKKKK